MKVFITGFMGAGKTTVGKALADRLQIPVMDTDGLIVERMGKTILAIFAEEGESFFREAEAKVLRSLSDKDCIVTTGGGIIQDKANRDWMRTNGIVIYLRCGFKEIARRLEGDTGRPLITGKRMEEIEQLYKKRKHLYEEADFVVDVTGKDVEKIAEEVVSCLKSAE